MKKTEILQSVRDAHDKLLKSLDGLTEEEATRVGLNARWSIKDALSHIAAWEEEGVRIIREAEAGTWKPHRLSENEINEFNARVVEGRRSISMREVSDVFNEAHAAMLALINTLSDEIDESSMTYRYINAVTVRHMTHHAAQISEYRKSL